MMPIRMRPPLHQGAPRRRKDTPTLPTWDYHGRADVAGRPPPRSTRARSRGAPDQPGSAAVPAAPDRRGGTRRDRADRSRTIEALIPDLFSGEHRNWFVELIDGGAPRRVLDGNLKGLRGDDSELPIEIELAHAVIDGAQHLVARIVDETDR